MNEVPLWPNCSTLRRCVSFTESHPLHTLKRIGRSGTGDPGWREIRSLLAVHFSQTTYRCSRTMVDETPPNTPNMDHTVQSNKLSLCDAPQVASRLIRSYCSPYVGA